MRYCMKCGTANEDRMTFCITCGSPLGDIPQQLAGSSSQPRHSAARPVAQAAYNTPDVGIRCNCGYVNSASQRFCLKCGQQLQAEAYAPNPMRGVNVREQKSGGFPVAAIVILVIVALLIAGAAAYCVINGVPELPFMASSEQQSSDAASGTKRVPSNSVDAVACSSQTKIVPLDPDGVPIESYVARISPRNGGSSIDTELRISGSGGFTIEDFNDPQAASSAKLKEGTYEIVMTEDGGRRECVVRVEYRKSNAAAVSVVEVVAAK